MRETAIEARAAVGGESGHVDNYSVVWLILSWNFIPTTFNKPFNIPTNTPPHPFPSSPIALWVFCSCGDWLLLCWSSAENRACRLIMHSVWRYNAIVQRQRSSLKATSTMPELFLTLPENSLIKQRYCHWIWKHILNFKLSMKNDHTTKAYMTQ